MLKYKLNRIQRFSDLLNLRIVHPYNYMQCKIIAFECTLLFVGTCNIVLVILKYACTYGEFVILYFFCRRC